jgi:hypothetical protein
MKKLTLTLLTCLLLLSPNVVLSETFDDLVKRNGVYYKKFSEVPFSCKTSINFAKWTKVCKELSVVTQLEQRMG